MSELIPESLEGLRVPVKSLKYYGRNPRSGNVDAIAESLSVNGQYRPVVVNSRNGEVLAGNHTLKAARKLGWTEIAATYVDADDEQAARIVLVDNRSNDLAEYDDGVLAELLQEIEDLAGTGFSDSDLADLLDKLEPEQLPPVVPEDTEPTAPPKDPITKRGDVWLLGPHRLICGDCRDFGDVERLMAGNRANVVFTSPPYAEQREYDKSSGFKPIRPDDYVDWWEDLQANVRSVIADDGSFFVNIKPSITADGLDTLLYVHDLVIAHVRRWGWHFATEFCWERNGVPKSVTRRFKNQFEPVYQFTAGDWKMRPDAVRHESDNVPVAGGPGVGDTGCANAQGGNGQMFGGARKRAHGTRSLGGEDIQGTNWQPGEYIGPGMAYPGNRLPTFAGSHEATGHTAAFPVGLPEFFIKAYTDEGDHVLDPFMGSGSTLLAAHKTGRTGYGSELSPAYCDVILNRYQRHTGDKPVLESTGEQHDFAS